MKIVREYSSMSSAIRALKRIAEKNDLWMMQGNRLYYNDRGRWAKIEKVVDNMGFCEKVLIKANFEL